MEEKAKGTVCVTGGTGFVASWLIMRLLQHGYSIRATIRPNQTDSKRDISYLTNLPGATERLEILEADLNRPESFDAAIRGCTGVFHVAHPMDVSGREPEEAVTRRAVEGTLGILRACLRNSQTLRRVVYTSSAVTVLFGGHAGPVDEDTWSDVEACRGFGAVVSPSYVVSKTVAERTALEFAQNNGLDLVTLVLPLVVGPFVCPNVPSSVYMPLASIFGGDQAYKYKHLVFYMVHTDDVASAHIFLFECPDVKGRYICSSADVTVHELFDTLSTKYPEFQLSLPDELKEITLNKGLFRLKSEKLLSAGFKFKYGIDQILDGAIQCCKDKGLLSHVISHDSTTSEEKL